MSTTKLKNECTLDEYNKTIAFCEGALWVLESCKHYKSFDNRLCRKIEEYFKENGVYVGCRLEVVYGDLRFKAYTSHKYFSYGSVNENYYGQVCCFYYVKDFASLVRGLEECLERTRSHKAELCSAIDGFDADKEKMQGVISELSQYSNTFAGYGFNSGVRAAIRELEESFQ